ncbi:VOC family protein [Ornithinibacillus californiensis]|uniref:VOC family protein n=1 Tax=Ornithinibacillus californiensis TaxID=161536 RepID=UPI00064D89F6|nr:VOC family protein [Ornithinibacillus californiensis]
MRGIIHHIELYVSDLEKSTEFWGWLLEELGYNLFQTWNQGRSYKLKDSYLVFVQAEERFLDVPYHRKRVGLNHLAFYAESREHVDEVTNQLKEKGVTILYEDKHPYAGGEGYYAVFFEDPDRIKVEIVAPK